MCVSLSVVERDATISRTYILYARQSAFRYYYAEGNAGVTFAVFRKHGEETVKLTTTCSRSCEHIYVKLAWKVRVHAPFRLSRKSASQTDGERKRIERRTQNRKSVIYTYLRRSSRRLDYLVRIAYSVCCFFVLFFCNISHKSHHPRAVIAECYTRTK